MAPVLSVRGRFAQASDRRRSRSFSLSPDPAADRPTTHRPLFLKLLEKEEEARREMIALLEKKGGKGGGGGWGTIYLKGPT